MTLQTKEVLSTAFVSRVFVEVSNDILTLEIEPTSGENVISMLITEDEARGIVRGLQAGLKLTKQIRLAK